MKDSFYFTLYGKVKFLDKTLKIVRLPKRFAFIPSERIEFHFLIFEC